MTKVYTRICFFLLLLLPAFSNAQNTLIYSNDFEGNNSTVHLNVVDTGTNTGPNQWIINNSYIGLPTFQNTTSQDSTIGGQISSPNGHYLHIHDVNVSSVTNANFDPNLSSDRFTSIGPFCTIGDDSIHLAFFYLGKGNANAYGQVYYQADGGPWKLLALDSGATKWKYQDLTDTAFNNHVSLQFGFRWVNGVSTDTTSSFAIDDIKIVAKADLANYPITIKVDTIYPSPVCAGDLIFFHYSVSAPVCTDVDDDYILISSSGPPQDLGNLIWSGNNLEPGLIFASVPSASPAGTCYQVVVVRSLSGTTPPVLIVSDTSACIQVTRCPVVVTIAADPSVFTQDTVCAGSAIDVPFQSYGAFLNGNQYIAQLSDSNGIFQSIPNTLGTFNSGDQFNNPLAPGNVSGLIAGSSTAIPPGCNYMIRVISTRPADTSAAIGPFCIRNCDIETNQFQNIQACVTQTTGQDFTIPIDVNVFNSNAVYASDDTFQVQVLNPANLAVINTGGLGYIVANNSTTIDIHVPDLPGLAALNLGPGNYYLRIVATNSSTPWNALGTIVHLGIGAPAPSPLVIYFNNGISNSVAHDTSLCANKNFLLYQLNGTNQMSHYTLTFGYKSPTANTFQSTDYTDFTGLNYNFPFAGTYQFYWVETNFGCTGPGTADTIQVNAKGAPPDTIIGPSQVCLGDTIGYSVRLDNTAYYIWSSTADTISTNYNNVTVTFPQSGIRQVRIHAVGPCGDTINTKSITVKTYPVAEAGNDTTVCRGSPVPLTTPINNPNTQYSYLWSNGVTSRDNPVTPTVTTTYTIAATNKIQGGIGCVTHDTVTVFVKQPPILETPDSVCPGATIKLDATTGNSTYHWNTNDTGPFIVINSTGSYSVTIHNADSACTIMRIYDVKQDSDCPDFTNVFSPNGDGFNDDWGNTKNEILDNFSVKIFDRWGHEVYTSTDSQFRWKGVDKSGDKVSNGVYFYEVIAGSGSTQKKLHGSITVMK